MKAPIPFFLATALCVFLAGCGTKSEEDISAVVSVKLQYMFGMQPNATLDPDKDAACKTKYSGYIGKPVKTTYNIEPEGIKSATSIFEGKTLDLSDMRVEGHYSFGIFRPENFPEAYAVIFSMSLGFTDPVSTINLKEDGYNCLLSSAKDPFSRAESSKYFGQE